MNSKLKDIVEGAWWGVKAAFDGGTSDIDQRIGPWGSSRYISDTKIITSYVVRWGVRGAVVGLVGLGAYYALS